MTGGKISSFPLLLVHLAFQYCYVLLNGNDKEKAPIKSRDKAEGVETVFM